MDGRLLPSNTPLNASTLSNATQYESQTTSELLNYLDIEPEFRQTMADLSGQKWDDKNGKFIHNPVAIPLMNHKGLQVVSMISRVYFSKSAIINDLDEKQINKMMWSYSRYILKMLTYSAMRKEYGIKPVDSLTISEILMKPAYLNLNRSLHRHELDALTKIVKSAETVSHNIEQRSRFNPFGVFKLGRKS